MHNIFLGNSPIHNSVLPVKGSFITEKDQLWYRIENYDQMPAFFMSLTNPDNIWMFISSTGGLTCGREHTDRALFPYSTVDKVTDSFNHTGSFTNFLVKQGDDYLLWEPLRWNSTKVYNIERNLWKTEYGDCIRFEEVNHSLGLTFSVSWEGSPEFGIHRSCRLKNISENSASITYLDGIRNIMPAGSDAHTQTELSNLLDAYKRTESDPELQLGIYALSATLTDLAEPSECLLANSVWSYGVDNTTLLLSEKQVSSFLAGNPVHPELDIKGSRGAYLLNGSLELPPGQESIWGFCAELTQDHSAIEQLRKNLRNKKKAFVSALMQDIEFSRKKMRDILAMNDGIQNTGSIESNIHHAANVLFNVMRGGYFIDGYMINTQEFINFVHQWNKQTGEKYSGLLNSLPEKMHINRLKTILREQKDAKLQRFALEYLPLTFGRRHGDPSRPWNQFHITTRDKSGNPIIGYQGNWRDIFQNWEALCLSYPLFFPSVIAKFLNATTIDGYNPYRISQNGIDWESPNPGDPWGNIGYWSDHQIIYLTKLLEHAHNFLPGSLEDLTYAEIFVFGDVPYRLNNYAELVKNPGFSIVFDNEHEQEISKRVEKTGSDGRLVHGADGSIIRTHMVEKLLILLLAKVTNYIPGGGIWMNTQRPEWNDANNALAGWGLSMVTLSYLTRFIEIVKAIIQPNDKIAIHIEAADWIRGSREALEKHGEAAVNNPEIRFRLMDDLGAHGTNYRNKVYNDSYSGIRKQIEGTSVLAFIELCYENFSRTIEAAVREDGSYESYQVLQLRDNKAYIKQLYPMLEGQAAGLSIQNQPAERTIGVLKTLQKGPLYREDQSSYMLYPNRDLPRYLEKNTINTKHHEFIENIVNSDSLPSGTIVSDVNGKWHFNGSFRNVNDLLKLAGKMSNDQVVMLREIFEETFNHAEFTGRSGTFFAFEGLGSIYWHMVSKLLLAVQERYIESIMRKDAVSERAQLKALYGKVREGIGFNKTPEVYGAFPTDPYSHTPWGQGAKQPGMTGQVKEEIITRYGELGLIVRNGSILFIPELILDDQWNRQTRDFTFTYCGVVFTITESPENSLSVYYSDRSEKLLSGLQLPKNISRDIFSRSGKVEKISVQVQNNSVKHT
jgi:hypothetical protein